MSRHTISQNEYGIPSKIHPIHRKRMAIVYVRQSTLQQVERHQESTRLQYGLVDRAIALGWVSSQVEVIDEDLGQSGRSIEGRPGFQRLVAEVGLDHVGIILGIEMSRLARSCRDWHQLLEICALFHTLIGDLDGIYDPSDYNDRLLLGLKGTMSEAELHILKRRMLEGKRAKARRGELGMPVPMGYVQSLSGEVMKDPDEQAQQVIELLFATFNRVRTIDGVLRYFVQHSIQMPCRIRSGAQKGNLKWNRPNRQTLHNILHNPLYAGAYVYGRRPTDPKKQKPGRPFTGLTVARLDQWQVCLKDRLPAYISWETFEANLKQLQLNTSQSLGVARNGPSLLSGLLVCGHCGQKMRTNYGQNGKELRYRCDRNRNDYGLEICQSLKGTVLDQQITDLVLEALKPSMLQVSLKVAEDIELQRAGLHKLWKQRLERAEYQVQRTFRQYDAVEPENRLVARTLEQQWEETLENLEELKKEYHHFCAQQPVCLSDEDKQNIVQLSKDIPQIWYASTTEASDRQTIVRQLLDQIIVTVEGESEKVNLICHWKGGYQTSCQFLRPVARWEQLSYFPKLLEKVKQLYESHSNCQEIAQTLNQEGWRPPKRRETFNAEMIQNLLLRKGLSLRGQRKTPSQLAQRQKNEWTVTELAQKLGLPRPTLHAWVRKGKLKARLDTSSKRSLWLVQADKNELEHIQTMRQEPRRWSLYLHSD